jgi:hypothetical protein
MKEKRGMRNTTLLAIIPLAASLMFACGGSDDDDEAGPTDAIVGSWGANIPAGMGGADPDPETDVVATLSDDGTGEFVYTAMVEVLGEVTITFGADWTANDDGEYSVALECTGVEPTGYEDFGLSCDEFPSETVECTLSGSDLSCDDSSDDNIEFTKN